MLQTPELRGSLTFDTRLVAVLRQIAEKQHTGLGVLRINEVSDSLGEQRTVSGDIVIKDCKYVCAAVVRSNARKRPVYQGYKALRALCAFAKADYEYFSDCSDAGELNLNILLSKVIELAPSLPEDQSALQNDESMLDHIFGTLSDNSCPPITPIAEPSGKAAKKTPKSSWVNAPAFMRKPKPTPVVSSQSLEERAELEDFASGCMYGGREKNRLLDKIGDRLPAPVLKTLKRCKPLASWLMKESHAIMIFAAVIGTTYAAATYIAANIHSDHAASAKAKVNASAHRNFRHRS